MTRNHNLDYFWRFNLIKYLFCLFCLIAITRLFQIQVINASKYKAQAREQQWQGYELSAKRGTIYTSDNYPVASQITSYQLFVNSDNASHDLNSYRDLFKIVPELDKSSIEQAFNSQSHWIKLISGLSFEQSEQIKSLKLKGFELEEEYKRYYPEGNLLSHLLGFVGKDKDAIDTGYYGIERYYDGDLQGQSGWLYQEKSATGLPILWGGTERVAPIDGTDIYLTINRQIQFIVEKELKEGVERYGAKSGTVVIINPSNGEVISMANYPDFNPSDYISVDDSTLYRNTAISTIYEPGSVMKAITMSAAIDSGKVVPMTIYNDTGPRYFSGHKVDNWDGKHHGEETMIEVLQHSNNLGAAWVGQQIGDVSLMSYFRSFGLGDKLGIDLEGEETGKLYDKFPLKDIELANAAFGQGVSVTPLQITAAFSAIANDGILYRPHVVSKLVTKKDDRVIEIAPEVLNRPISKASADTMVDMLTQAVEGGEAKFFISKKYDIAGKTGTAQVPIPGGYDPNRTNATFVGFFPTYKNFVMLVKLQEPVFPSGYSAETAVPLWMKIAQELADYYRLRPDKSVKNYE